MSHPMDWERAIVDTIEFDKAVGVARAFAARHPDTLIVVTGDHTHGISIVGTIDDDKPRITSYNVCYTKLLRWRRPSFPAATSSRSLPG